MKLIDRSRCPDAPLAQADPYMIRASDGCYYLYATGGQAYRSQEPAKGWDYLGCRLTMPGQHACWAPSVMEANGKYYMYYSSIDDGVTDVHGQTMRVAVSDTPDGPFVYHRSLLPPFSIDPHAVVTPSGMYLFYCGNEEDVPRPGTHVYCDRLVSPDEVEGKPVCVIRPTIDEEIFMRDRFHPGQHWHTIEGAFYFYYQGVHFLMYSGACFENPTYFIGYCTAEGPENADLRTLAWEKYPSPDTWNPLVFPNKAAEGMGHNSVLFDGDDAYIVYHARDIGDCIPGTDTRSGRIARLNMNGKQLTVAPI